MDRGWSADEVKRERLDDGEALSEAWGRDAQLQDIDAANTAIGEIARVLETDGRLCLAMVHPLNSAGQFESEEPDSPFVVQGSYLGSFRYRDTIEQADLPMTFESVHRPIEWCVESLAAEGFVVERLREVRFPDHAVTQPRNRRRQRIPLFLHVRAVRP